MSIVYKSGGKLGDLFEEMSIIREVFYNTKKKGTLYITGEEWSTSLEETFNYIKEVVNLQPYIENFEIYNNQNFDVDLSLWRNYIYKNSLTFGELLSYMYNVNWASNPWIENIKIDDKWSNVIFVSTTSYRPLSNNITDYFKNIKNENLIFIGNFDEHYEDFKKRYGLENIKRYCPISFMDLCIAINSCKLFIGNLNAHSTIARGLGKESIICAHKDFNEFRIFSDFKKYIKNVTYII